MMRVTDVPAGTGLMLKGTAGDTYEIPYSESTSVYANLLVGTTAATELQQTDGGYTNYVLGANGFQIVSASGGSLTAWKAYLRIPSHIAGSRSVLAMPFDDEASGISDAVADGNDGAYYTVSGMRVAKPQQKGIYLHNGRKVYVK